MILQCLALEVMLILQILQVLNVLLCFLVYRAKKKFIIVTINFRRNTTFKDFLGTRDVVMKMEQASAVAS